jgi:hypothetical protein
MSQRIYTMDGMGVVRALRTPGLDPAFQSAAEDEIDS